MRKIKLFLFFFFFSASAAQALTLAQLRTAIRLRVKDANSSRQRYSDTDLTNIINQDQRDAVNFSWIIKKSTSIELVSGTTYYTVPTDIMAIERITLRHYNIPEVTLQTLDSNANFGPWLTSKGTPTQYFQDPAQPTKIGVYPWPASSSSTGTLRINYYAQPTDLSADSDVPFNSDVRYYPYHDALVFGPCYKIMLIEGEMDKAAEYKSFYQERLQLLANLSNAKPNFLPGFAGQRK